MHSWRYGAGSPRRASFTRIPAVRALFAQAAGFALVLILAHALPQIAGIQLTIAVAAVVQGIVAAALARMLHLAPWWVAIGLCFPVALLASSALPLPPFAYLAGFLILLVLYWSTFRTQVPFYPSNRATWRAVAQLLPAGRPLRIADVGSGFGGLVMYLAGERPESEVIGIELAPLPWLCSRLRGPAAGSAGRFVRRDYETVDFADFDVVFAYLSPAAMPALWQKARAEMRHGALLLSYEFAIPGAEPDVVVHPSDGGPALYGWRIQ